MNELRIASSDIVSDTMSFCTRQKKMKEKEEKEKVEEIELGVIRVLRG